jgi:cation transport ATPase
MHRILVTALALSAIAVAQAAPTNPPSTTKLTVNGMVCAFCAQGIEKRLTALPQTQAVYVNLGKKLVAVQARPGQTLDTAKVRAEISEAGFDVTKVETSDESVETIRAAMKARK